MLRQRCDDTRVALTPEQQRIVEFGDGPVVVIAAPAPARRASSSSACAGSSRRTAGSHATHAHAATTPFGSPLLPEQILVLTYNVKAARELGERLEAAARPGHRRASPSATSTASATAC